MHNVTIKDKKEIGSYRNKIFASKDEYRRKLMKLPFEMKMNILLKLQERTRIFKKLKK